jgi:hypothetical protein
MMGTESVKYHRVTVLERADDFAGMALEYYASRGETPLLWGGSGGISLGVSAAVSPDAYEAVYGSGGARHPENYSTDLLVVRQTSFSCPPARRPDVGLLPTCQSGLDEDLRQPRQEVDGLFT